MASFHQTIIVGNLGRDPESRHMASGDMVCNFSVAVTESWKDKNSGEKRENTTWYRVNVFGKLAEICAQYLKKGSQVQVVGKIKSRDWEDKDGVKKTAWELQADQMIMLGSAGGSGGGQGNGPSQHQQQKQDGYQNQGGQQRQAPKQDYDDSIPF